MVGLECGASIRLFRAGAVATATICISDEHNGDRLRRGSSRFVPTHVQTNCRVLLMAGVFKRLGPSGR